MTDPGRRMKPIGACRWIDPQAIGMKSALEDLDTAFKGRAAKVQ